MPGAEGIDVVAWARRHDRPTAILMLTARDTPADRIRASTRAPTTTWSSRSTSASCSPASVPFSGARAASTPRSSSAAGSTWIRFDAGPRWTRPAAEPDRHRVPDPGAAHAARRRRVVDRKSIAEHAWADETDPLGSNAIDVQLSRLRAKLPSAGIRIVTVRGAGYRLEET